MSDLLRDQAETVVELMLKLIRRFSATDQPVMEMPVAQVRVCGILQEGPRTMSALSKELGISLSAVTQIADRLEKSTLVERVPETCDRRCKLLQLTARGNELMLARRDNRIDRVIAALNRLSPETRETVVASFRQLLDAGILDESESTIISTPVSGPA